ncbi:PEGA domain-containing protein [Chondromyces crocatus]|uniref:PEGA domain-containing protein n=1 Tax=Chondromyces crocatus TaxID=52 RepID=A0A0K1E7D4_CHOCO|nr:PEGA domain-containing protein [Chondromyces crocatus]AKT36488.1 uncharacterized protein CMC5_006040 [Chondromyces crocatus]
MRLPRALLFAATFAALVPASPHPASAQLSAEQRAEAQSLTTQGRNALRQQRFADAIDPLTRAVELAPTPQLKLELAQALSGAQRLVEASKILHEIGNAPAETPQAKQTQAAARKMVSEVEARIPWIQIAVLGPKEGEARILIDGKETDASFEVPIDPGEHTVRVEAEGFKPVERQPALAEGEHLELELTLEPDGSVEKEVEPAPLPPPKPRRSTPTLAMVAFGAGGLGVAVGSLFGILAFTETSAAKEHCAGNICPNTPDVVSSRDAALRNGTISTVGFVVGGVGLAAGAVLLLTAPKRPAPSASPSQEAATIRPWIGAGQAGVVGTF